MFDGKGDMFVTNADTGTIGGTVGEYTTSGAVINAALITGLNYPTGLALDGNGDLFVVSKNDGLIGEYTTSGAVINASLITGLQGSVWHNARR